MVRLSNLEELLNMYPHFLDRTPNNGAEKGSVHYRINKIKNNQYNSLRTSIKLLTYANNLNRPILIYKEQTEPKKYEINFKVNIENLKTIQIHKINPLTQNEILTQEDNIFYSKNFTQESNTNQYEISFTETCTTNIPLYQYIITVETYDEHYLVKGYPENDNEQSIIYIKDTYNDNNNISYDLITTIEEDNYNTNEYGENYFRFIFNHPLNNNYYPITHPDIYVFSKEIEELIDGEYTYFNWEAEPVEMELIQLNVDGEIRDIESYKINYEDGKVYCIVAVAKDDYFSISYYPFLNLHDYNIFSHDEQLDVLGAKLNVKRWTHKQVETPSKYHLTEPPFHNRLDEDDYHYQNRIQTYITNYGDKYLPELEIWKEYGIPSILTNRKTKVATQCDTHMWTDCCEDNDNIIKNKTTITLLTSDLTSHYNKPLKINVAVTCEDNEAIYNVLNGYVEFRFNGENQYAKVKNGIATLTYTLNHTDYKTTPLQIQYIGYDEYDESNTITTNITFKGKTVKINMLGTNYSATRGDNIQLHGKVTSGDEIINDGVISFYHNGELLCEGNVRENQVNIRYTIPNSMSTGINNITAIYVDDRDTPVYDTASTEFKLNVLKERLNTHIESILFYPHGFSLRLHDSTNETVENQVLYIYEEDKEIGRIKTYSQFYSTYYDPTLQIDFNKKYYVEFKGSQSYNPVKSRIYPVPKPVYKETHFVTIMVNNHFAFKLHDGRDNTLWDKTVTIRLNGTLHSTKTTKHDWVWVSFDEHIDETDQITLQFNGDDDYNPCTGTFTQIAPVSENETNIRIIEDNYHTEVGQAVDIYAQLLDKNNNPLTDYELYFYHRDPILPDTFISKTYTDSDGIASCTFTPYSNKNTYVKCEFKGNSWYDKSSNLARIIVGAGEEAVLKPTSKIQDTYKCLDTIQLQLTNKEGEGLSNRKISLAEHQTITDTSTNEDIGNDNKFITKTTDKDGYVNIPIQHGSGTYTLSAIFDGDDIYKPVKTILGEVTLTKRNLCMTTYPSHNGTLHSGTHINTRVYDCLTNEGINDVKVYYYFKRISTQAYQNLSPVLTTTNNLEQDGYAYRKINYADGEYLVGVTIVDPKNMYNNKSTVYENFNVDLNDDLIDTTNWENDKYLYPIHITSEGAIKTHISLSTETIVSGEDIVATLIDENGYPLSGKTVYFRNADNLTFAEVETDKFGHARQTFNMAEVKNKVMYYGWESDDPVYESVENTAHLTINRRSLCFVENNLNADSTIPVGFIYKNRLVDCRDYNEGLVDTSNYSRSMYGKVVSITFERFKKDTGESLGRTAPYYILINREDGRFEFPITLAPSGVNGDYHYTFELNYDYDLNDNEYRNIDGYYNDKQTYPIKFYTQEIVEPKKIPVFNISAKPEDVEEGREYILTAQLSPNPEALSEGRVVDDIQGYILFKTQNGAYLNENNPSKIKYGSAVWRGINNASPNQTFQIYAEYISTQPLFFTSCTSEDYTIINTIETGGSSNKPTTNINVNDITPTTGRTGDTFTVTVTVTSNGENVTNGTCTITGFDGELIQQETVNNGTCTLTCTVPNVDLGYYSDLFVSYKSDDYKSSGTSLSDFRVTETIISPEKQTPIMRVEIDDTVTEDNDLNYTVYVLTSNNIEVTGNVRVEYDGNTNTTILNNYGSGSGTIQLNGTGLHTIRFRYLGNDDYNETSIVKTVEVVSNSNPNTKSTPNIRMLNIVGVNEGDNYSITVFVDGDSVRGYPTGRVALYKNGDYLTEGNLNQVVDNTSNIVFTPSSTGDSGTVKFKAKYLGDTNYNETGFSTEKSATVTPTSTPIVKQNPTIQITGTSPIQQGSNYNLTVTVVGDTNNGNPTGTVELYKGRSKIDTKTLQRYNSSTSKITFTPSSSGDTGNKSFKAKYLGDTNYNSTGYSDTVNVQVEQPTNLTLRNYTIKSGTTGTVEAILTDNNNVRLSGKTVTINIGGATYTMVSEGNGVYSKTINMTGNRNGTMKASFNGETGAYSSCSSKTCSLIIYQNRVGYGNLWILYPNSFSQGTGLPFYIVDSGQNPLNGYSVDVKYTRINTGTTYPYSSVVTCSSNSTGLITSQTVSYEWSNASLEFVVTFKDSTATISMGEGGSLSNLPSGASVTFDVTYNP